MAPAASILSAAAAASSKRPADTEPEQLRADSSSSALPQVGDDASRSKSQSHQQQLECPRCRSTNTKFCYYNNYSTSQPRHFCRACRRYWTHGGTLRDVPVGGATRRTKRRKVSDDEPSLSASSPPPHTTAATSQQDLSSTACFPFLSDGSYYLPQLDLGFFAQPAAFSSAVLPDFYDGLAPWDDGTLAISGAWPGDNIAGSLEFSWPPPGN